MNKPAGRNKHVTMGSICQMKTSTMMNSSNANSARTNQPRFRAESIGLGGWLQFFCWQDLLSHGYVIYEQAVVRNCCRWFAPSFAESGLSAEAGGDGGGDSSKVCCRTFSRHGFSTAGRNQRKNSAGDKTQQAFTVFSLEQSLISNFCAILGLTPLRPGDTPLPATVTTEPDADSRRDTASTTPPGHRVTGPSPRTAPAQNPARADRGWRQRRPGSESDFPVRCNPPAVRETAASASDSNPGDDSCLSQTPAKRKCFIHARLFT